MRNGSSSYTFDQIGNRIQVSTPDEPHPVDYVTNALNQYEEIGAAPVEPTYDLDGNRVDDGRGKTFTWTGENRMETITIGAKVITNTYDGQGRRVRKLVEDGGSVTSDTRFLYDGWNLVQSTTLSNDGVITGTRNYVWGLDLSQSMQGAGGVGGLLFTDDNSATHAVTYDANGNVSEYIDLADGSVDAHLEYDAFGRTIASTGTAPAAFGFSTKLLDEETGYYYYGFRFLDPETGRWLNRDPIGERGGYNLYVFALNNSLDYFDPLGNAAAVITVAPGALIVVASAMVAVAAIPGLPEATADAILLAAEAVGEAAEAMIEGLADATVKYEIMCSKLNASVQAAKVFRNSFKPGRCKCNMSCYELEARRAAWLTEAITRAHRDTVCWGGGDLGHQIAQAAAWAHVGNCVAIKLGKGCP